MSDTNENGTLATPPTPPEAENLNVVSENAIPQSRFNEVIAARNAERAAREEAERQLAALQAEKEAAAQAALAEQGKFQELYEQTLPRAERADALEETLKTYLAAELETIPEHLQKLIPSGDITTRLNWITQARSEGLFTPPTAPSMDAGARGDNTKPITAKATQEDVEWAARLGMSLEAYMRRKLEG